MPCMLRAVDTVIQARLGVRDGPQHNNVVDEKVGVRKLAHNLQLMVSQHIYIAYSGGVDSHVLLHLCASNGQLKNKITAVYVNHGLQVEARSLG